MAGKDVSIHLSLKDNELVKRQLLTLGDEGQRALKRLEGASQPASRGLLALNPASGHLRGNVEGVAGRSGVAGAALTALGPAGLAAAAGIRAAAIGFQQLYQRTRQALEALSQVKREAEVASIGVEAYQELAYAAEQYKIRQDALTDGLKELALRADKFAVTGKGSAADAFGRLGFTVQEVNTYAQDTPAFLEEIIRRMEDLDKASQFRISDELFGGTGGEQFVAMIAGGVDALRQFKAEARAIGLVVDKELIEKADETNRQINTLWKVVDMQFSAALVDLGPVVLGMARLIRHSAAATSAALQGRGTP